MTVLPRYWVRTLPEDRGQQLAPGWHIHALMRDYPAVMGMLSVYLSSLEPGAMPHEPHSHGEGEIIVLLSGALDLLAGESTTRIGPGSFFYHAPGELHTIRGAGSAAARFIVLKWRDPPAAARPAGPGTFIHQAGTAAEDVSRREQIGDFGVSGPSFIRAQHCYLGRDQGYPVHSHDHDVMLILLDGRLRNLGHDVEAPAVTYYAAGVPHCHRPNPTAGVNFLAFEFHGG